MAKARLFLGLMIFALLVGIPAVQAQGGLSSFDVTAQNTPESAAFPFVWQQRLVFPDDWLVDGNQVVWRDVGVTSDDTIYVAITVEDAAAQVLGSTVVVLDNMGIVHHAFSDPIKHIQRIVTVPDGSLWVLGDKTVTRLRLNGEVVSEFSIEKSASFIGIDHDGLLYIPQIGDGVYAIAIYDSEGNKVSSFGIPTFDILDAFAVAPDGTVYLSALDIVLSYSPAGEIINGAFGFEILGGQSIEALATDADNRLYVAAKQADATFNLYQFEPNANLLTQTSGQLFSDAASADVLAGMIVLSDGNLVGVAEKRVFSIGIGAEDNSAATPEATEEATPEATAEATDEATPEATDEATPEATDEATPEATEEATDEPTPEVTEEATDEIPAATIEPTATVDAVLEAVNATLTALAPTFTPTITVTPLPPSATATETPDPILAAVNATLTAMVPTNTPTITPTPLPPTPTATNTLDPVSAAVNATLTALAPTATNTATASPTASATATQLTIPYINSTNASQLSEMHKFTQSGNPNFMGIINQYDVFFVTNGYRLYYANFVDDILELIYELPNGTITGFTTNPNSAEGRAMSICVGFEFLGVCESSGIFASDGMQVEGNRLHTMSYSPNGNYILGMDHILGTLYVRDARSGTSRQSFGGTFLGGSVGSYAVSPDNRRLAVSYYDKIVIYDFDNGNTLYTVTMTDYSYSMAFSSDGRYLAYQGCTPDLSGTACEPPWIEIYDTQTRSKIHRIEGNLNESYRNLVFSGDDSAVIATGCGRPTGNSCSRGDLVFFDVASGTMGVRVAAHDSYIYKAALTPDGLALITMGLCGNGCTELKLWLVDPNKPAATPPPTVPSVATNTPVPQATAVAEANLGETVLLTETLLSAEEDLLVRYPSGWEAYPLGSKNFALYRAEHVFIEGYAVETSAMTLDEMRDSIPTPYVEREAVETEEIGYSDGSHGYITLYNAIGDDVLYHVTRQTSNGFIVSLWVNFVSNEPLNQRALALAIIESVQVGDFQTLSTPEPTAVAEVNLGDTGLLTETIVSPEGDLVVRYPSEWQGNAWGYQHFSLFHESEELSITGWAELNEIMGIPLAEYRSNDQMNFEYSGDAGVLFEDLSFSDGSIGYIAHYDYGEGYVTYELARQADDFVVFLTGNFTRYQPAAQVPILLDIALSVELGDGLDSLVSFSKELPAGAKPSVITPEAGDICLNDSGSLLQGVRLADDEYYYSAAVTAFGTENSWEGAWEASPGTSITVQLVNPPNTVGDLHLSLVLSGFEFIDYYDLATAPAGSPLTYTFDDRPAPRGYMVWVDNSWTDTPNERLFLAASCNTGTASNAASAGTTPQPTAVAELPTADLSDTFTLPNGIPAMQPSNTVSLTEQAVLDARLLSPDLKTLVRDVEGNAILFDTASGEEIAVLGAVYALAYSPDGASLAFVEADTGQVRLIDAHDGTDSGVSFDSIQPDTRSQSRFSSDGAILGILDSNAIWVWNASTGELLGTLSNSNPARVFDLFMDGQRVAASGATGSDVAINIWRFDNLNAPINSVTGHEGSVSSLAFSQDDTLLASGSIDRTIRILGQGRVNDILRGHRGAVIGLAFNPDYSLLASASEDGTVRLWDLVTEASFLSLPVQGQPHFSADGKVLFVETGQAVYVYSLPAGTPSASAPVICQITAPRIVNKRNGPGTNYSNVGQLAANQTVLADGQQEGTDGFAWYRLLDDTWVREDIVTAADDCSRVADIRFLVVRSIDTGIVPDDRTSVPPGARMLTGGYGLTNGARQPDGEFQVEWFCNSQGYGVRNDPDNWYCTSGGRDAVTLSIEDFDTLCQLTYNNSQAFAIQSTSNRNPAYRWRCFSFD